MTAELQSRLRDVLETNLKLLHALAERGDEPSRMHSVEHHFVSSDPAVLDRVARLGSLLGFTPADFGPHLEDGSYSFNLVSRTLLTPAVIHRESLVMEFLAQAHAVLYDGWGTHVEGLANAGPGPS